MERIMNCLGGKRALEMEVWINWPVDFWFSDGGKCRARWTDGYRIY